MLFYEVLNTVIPGYVDDLVRQLLEERKEVGANEEKAIQIRSDLLPLFNSRLFQLGPSRFLSQIARRR